MYTNVAHLENFVLDIGFHKRSLLVPEVPQTRHRLEPLPPTRHIIGRRPTIDTAILFLSLPTTSSQTMRLSSLCLLTVLATSSAFAPSQPPAVALTRSVALNLSNNNNNNNENNNHNLPSMEAVQNTLLSTVTAATLLMGSFAPFTADAANAAPATTNTMLMGSSLTLSAAPPVDPLAKERTTLTQSRTAYATASAPIAQLKNEVNVASSELAKDTAAVEKQMKKVKDVKKCLLDVNDKLAQAKGRGNEKLAGILAKNSGTSLLLLWIQLVRSPLWLVVNVVHHNNNNNISRNILLLPLPYTRTQPINQTTNQKQQTPKQNSKKTKRS